MIPGPFNYLAPTSLDEAVALLAEHGDDTKILAGGHSLIPAMRFRLASPEILIDINRIPDLEYVREEDGHLAIGALTRETALEESVLIGEKYPLLADTARVIADPLVRVRSRSTTSLSDSSRTLSGPMKSWPKSASRRRRRVRAVPNRHDSSGGRRPPCSRIPGLALLLLLRRVLELYPDRVVRVEIDAELPPDVDTPEDYELALSHWQATLRRIDD